MREIQILNRGEISGGSESGAEEMALDLLEEGINSVMPERVISEEITCGGEVIEVGGNEINLNSVNNIFLLGGGKASVEMARPLIEQLRPKITDGIIVTKRGKERGELNLNGVEIVEASHPVPDEVGQRGAERMMELASSATENDLVICLISGGGSALLPMPIQGVGLEEMSNITQLLLDSGATINEINAVRKHLSEIKGGKLARAIDPAEGISLLISDVVGDRLEVIASGPTAPDPTTFRDALRVIEKYELESVIPETALKYLRKNEARTKNETVKQSEFSKLRIKNYVLANNYRALNTMKRSAQRQNLETLLLSTMIEGESREAGIVHGGIVESINSEGTPLERPAVLLSGGETTVTMPEGGDSGGPNQEFVLGAATVINEGNEFAVASVDTDGEDGGGSAAGGIIGENIRCVDHTEIEKALNQHNSGKFLAKISGQIKTGPTGTNVNDIRVAVVL